MPSASGRALTHYPFSLLGILSISFTHSHQIPTCMPCSCLVFRIGGTIAPLLCTSPMTELQGGSCWSWTTYSFGPRPGISRTLGFGRSMSSRIHILNQPLSCLRVFVWSTTETKNNGCPASREEIRPELLISRSQLLASKQ
jgi:hypothetical protein